jgi:hypothetical protein
MELRCDGWALPNSAANRRPDSPERLNIRAHRLGLPVNKFFREACELRGRTRDGSPCRVSRGCGGRKNPKRALYGRVYNRTTVSVDQLAKKSGLGIGLVVVLLLVLGAIGPCLR